MTTSPSEVRAVAAAEGTATDPAYGPTHELPRWAGPAVQRVLGTGWGPAHTEAARFLGECFAAGALLGIVREMARPVWGQRHG
jgi:hypothetical protein